MDKTALNQAQSDYLKWLPKWLLGTFAAGAALRGTTGLIGMVGDNLKPEPEPPEPMMVNVPYRAHNQATAVEPPAGARPKRANWWLGSSAESPSEIPLAWPATVLGGAGAFLGGRALVNKLLERQKATQQEAELSDAKDDYEKAMLQQFTPLHHTKVVKSPQKPTITKLSELSSTAIQSIIDKTATDESLSAIADQLDDLAEKQATSWWNPFSWNYGSIARHAGGMYALGAPILGIGAAMGVNSYMNKHDPALAEAEAAKKRMQERTFKTPDVYARLVPIDDQGNVIKDEQNKRRREQTEGEQPISKAAQDLEAQAAAFVKELLG